MVCKGVGRAGFVELPTEVNSVVVLWPLLPGSEDYHLEHSHPGSGLVRLKAA